jgi:uncharacterized protein (DUF1697 family)
MARTTSRTAETVYVALLRGINVGRARQVSMADLREIAAGLGYANVRTLLRSGNLAFTSAEPSTARLAASLMEAIEARLGMQVGVVIRSADELAAIVAADPFPASDDEGTRKHVVFVADPLSAEVRDWLGREDFAPDEVRTADREVYVLYATGMSATTTADRLGKLLPRSATDRNWNTVTRLLALARESDAGPA